MIDSTGQKPSYVYFEEEPSAGRSLLGSIGLYHPPLAAEALTIARTIKHALWITENAA